MVVEISDWNDLDNVRNDLTGDYVLVNHLDENTDGYAGIGDDFNRLGVTGFDGAPFSGSFDGDGFAIKDFVLGDYGGDERGNGLFGGVADGGLVENLTISGVVDLIGFSGDPQYAGGLAGTVGAGSTGTIRNCVSHVDVTSDDDRVGGLVGANQATVTDSYATGSVEGGDRVGGLVGWNTSTVTDSYATGSVEGDGQVGGLVGRNQDTVTDSYWDTETTGQSTSSGGTGLTTAEMQGSEAESNMDGFDFADVWATVEADTETIDGQITLDDVAAETATVILHNFSEPESVEIQGHGYPILLSVDEDEQLDSQEILEEQSNIARTETDTDGNYSAEIIPATTGDTIAIAVDFDDGEQRYGRLVTTVLE